MYLIAPPLLADYPHSIASYNQANLTSHTSWKEGLCEIRRFDCFRRPRRSLSSDNRVSATDRDDRPSGSLQCPRGPTRWTIPLDLVVEIAGYIAFPDNISLLFLHTSVTRALRSSLYRRLEVGILTLEPDLAVSRLLGTHEVLCAGSTHPVRGRLELESLEVDAIGHDIHPCGYLSTFSYRQLTIFNLERPARALHDLMEMCPDLSIIQNITLYLHRFISYTDLLYSNDDTRARHIELTIVFPDCAELWPCVGDQQKVAYNQFIKAVSYHFPRLVVRGTRGWTEMPAGRDD